MVQAYGLITDGVNCLIPKKAVDNDLWQGERSKFGPVLVNQAGQFALFGGKVENDDKKAEDAVIRETREESGVSLKVMSPTFHEVTSNADYKCYAVLVSPSQLLQIQADMARNITSRNVTDGEMQSVTTLPLKDVSQYLGVPQAVQFTPTQQAQKEKGERKKPGRHSIDWYKGIASEVERQYLDIQKLADLDVASSRGGSPVGGEMMVPEGRSEDVDPAALPDLEGESAVIPSSSGEFRTTEEKVEAETERLHQDLIEHLKKGVIPYQGDVKTRDASVNAMADVIIENLKKDQVAMRKVLNEPQVLFSVCDARIGSAKIDRFLEMHHNAQGDVEHLFKEERYAHTKPASGMVASLLSKTETTKMGNIADYVAGAIKDDVRHTAVKTGEHDMVVKSLVDNADVPSGAVVGTATLGKYITPAKRGGNRDR